MMRERPSSPLGDQYFVVCAHIPTSCSWANEGKLDERRRRHPLAEPSRSAPESRHVGTADHSARNAMKCVEIWAMMMK